MKVGVSKPSPQFAYTLMSFAACQTMPPTGLACEKATRPLSSGFKAVM